MFFVEGMDIIEWQRKLKADHESQTGLKHSDGSNFRRTDSIDISKEWATASRMDKGLSPKGNGVIGAGKFS